MMKFKTYGIASLLLAMAFAGGTSAQTLQKLTVLHSQPVITSTFAYSSSLPVYLGYFREEGLDVEVNPMAGASQAMQLVIGGRADFAIGNPAGAMIAIQKNADVRFYYTSIRGDIFGIGLPSDSGLKGLADLKGKTIGVSSFASGGANYAKGLLKTVGLESGKDYNLVEIGVRARALGAYRSKQVQAFSLWDEEYASMSQNGVAMASIIKDPRAHEHIAGSILAKNEDFTKRRSVLIGVARAIAKAQVFQDANPEAAIRIHWKVYPSTAPKDGITDSATKRETEIIAVRKAITVRNSMGTNRWGDVPKELMEKFQAYLVETSVLPQTTDVNRYYTNDLIAEINKFDEAAIIKQAREYKVQ
ncbi:MAG: ABC transporter substrate-binding protein [Burkholderiales bacterium]|nr:ABC transporter substrate-binding protein [Burkholderiales bacterium]